MNNPLVSVCIQTYQHVHFIKQCLDGILMQQTNFSFEIILGEDESTDGTREICIEYANKYPDKINLFLRSRKDVIYINGNPTGRYNFIENLKASKGKYIALCEGDDYWTDPLKLQKQVDVLEANPHLVGCFHNSEERFWNDYSKASSLYLSLPTGREVSIHELTQYNMVPTASIVFKNTIPDELFTKEFLNSPVGDWPLHLLNTRNGNYYYIPQVMSVRNLNPKSVWGMQDQEKNVAQVVCVYNVLINSGWFKKEIVDLLKSGREILKNSIVTKNEIYSLKEKKASFFIIFKRKVINRLILILKKI